MGFENSNLARFLWDEAERKDSALAVVARDRQASFGEIRQLAGALRTRLREEGVRSSDRVAILLERGVNAVAAYFGALAAGAVVVIINERLRPRQIEHVLDDSGAVALVSDTDRLVRLPR